MKKEADGFQVTELLAAEEELHALKQEYGIEDTSKAKKGIDALIDRFGNRNPVPISKKKYCLSALFGGWFGLHCFLVGKKLRGFLYLLLSVTGISLAMSLLDILYAAFLETDEDKLIFI